MSQCLAARYRQSHQSFFPRRSASANSPPASQATPQTFHASSHCFCFPASYRLDITKTLFPPALTGQHTPDFMTSAPTLFTSQGMTHTALSLLPREMLDVGRARDRERLDNDHLARHWLTCAMRLDRLYLRPPVEGVGELNKAHCLWYYGHTTIQLIRRLLPSWRLPLLRKCSRLADLLRA